MAGEPVREWTRLLGSSANDSASSISTATDGSIYIAGGTNGSVDGQVNKGETDAFITKYKSDGSKDWTRLLGSSNYDFVNSISTSSDGSIYIAGTTGGSFDGQANSGGNSGSFDAFISKYNRDGSKAWTRLLGSSGNDQARSISTDGDGSVYITGYTNGSFDGQVSNGGSDAFISKFNSDGSKSWTRFHGSPRSDYANSIDATGDGSIYVTGYTSGSFDGQINSGGDDAFISKYTSDGSKVWTRLLGSSNDDEANSISIAADGSIYITGYTKGSFDGQVNRVFDDPFRQSDAFISKYNADGSKAWTRFYGTSGLDHANSVITPADGSIYIAGVSYFYGKTASQLANSTDAFISKYSSDGSMAWREYLGSSTSDEANAISNATDGSIYIAGTTSGFFDGQLKNGGSDAFISKYSRENNPPTRPPTISGDLKVGSTLGIDPTPIQDTDNFSGYTPEFKYSWEVSSNGTNWTPLPNTGDSSLNKYYTLTTAEVGKQIRGVVSYVDGYGTQESVPSASYSISATTNRTPTDLKISSTAFNENIASGSTVATLSTVDPDSGDSFSYDLVAGNGSTDNSYFSIFRTGLIIKASPDFETKSAYNIRIRTQDSGGLSLEKAFTLSVNDINETPIPTPSPQEPVANPGIIVRTTSGNNTTSETGTTASYSFVLKTAPTDRVTITFTLSDGSEGSLSSNTLIFTPGNWNTAQTLTVTGLDDYENDGDIPYVISAVVSSDDPNYGRRRDGTGGVSISNIELVNEDDGLEKDLTIYGDSNAPNYNDLLSGKNGSDRLYGDRGRDRLYGGRGGDRLYGGVDDDTLWGEDGDDDLYGNEDDDTLYGGNGNDRLTGGEGYDLLTGGIGNDTYVIDDEFDVIDDQGLESDQDKVIIRGNITAYTLPQGIEGATLDGTVAKNLIGNAGNNELIGNANNNLLDGGEGSDYLYSASGDDSVFGGGGDDQIVGGDGKGDDAYDGGEGEDTVIYKSSERNPIEVNLRSGFAKGAEIGSDTLKDIEHIVAGQQDDLITGDARDNKIDGLAGRDTAVFQGLRSEYLVSRNSAGKLVVQDKLGGRDGSDTLDNIELFKFADDTYNADEVLKGSKDALLGEGEHRGQGKGSRITTQVNQADRITLAPVSFKSTSPDIITGFLPAEDKIVLPKAVFAKLKNTNMTTISSKKQLKKSKSGLNSTQLVYNKMTGEVIYDENGKKKGLGAGGVFARFEDATLPNLTATNFELG